MSLRKDTGTWVVLLIILAVAAYFRVDFIRSVAHGMSHDAKNYSAMARQLLEQGIYGYDSRDPNAYVTPGYPLFLAAIFRIVGYQQRDPLPWVRFAQILLSMLTIIMLFRLSCRIAGRAAGLLAAAISAVYPPFIWANGAILTEVLATFLLVGYLLWQHIAIRRQSLLHAWIAGLWLGLTVLVRPEFLPALFAVYGYFWLARIENRRRLLLMFSTGLLGIILILMPWWIRNAVTLHRFIPLATQTNPLMAGTYPNNQFSDGMGVDTQGKTEKEIALERIRVGFTQHPRLFTWWYTFGKLKYTYGEMYAGGGYQPFYLVFPHERDLHKALVWLGVLALLAGGLQRRREVNYISVSLVLMSIIRLAFVPEFRYNFEEMPMLVLLDSIFLVQWVMMLFPEKQELPDGHYV